MKTKVHVLMLYMCVHVYFSPAPPLAPRGDGESGKGQRREGGWFEKKTFNWSRSHCPLHPFHRASKATERT